MHDLQKYIDSKRNIPFEWGVNDCCTFVLGALEIMLNRKDLVSSHGWRNYREAKQIIRTHGSLLSAVVKFMNYLKVHEVDTAYVSEGDIVVFEGPRGQTCGICLGSDLVCTGTNGVAFIPRKSTVLLGCFRTKGV